MRFFKKSKKITASLLLLAIVGSATFVPLSVFAADATNLGTKVTQETFSWGGTAIKVAGGAALAVGSAAALAAGAVALGIFTPVAATAAAGAGVLATGLTALSGLSASTVIGTGVVGAAAYQLGNFIDEGGFTGVTYGVVALLATIAKTILGGLLELAGRLFDWAIQLNFTIDFKNMSAVKAGWTIIRDFMNMGFLFILLYVAIGTILQLQGVDAKKSIVQIVLAAIFVNFSMFITGIFWDASTILVKEFYMAISGGAHRVSDLIAVAQNLAGMLDKSHLTGDRWTDGTINEISTVVVYGIFLRFLFVTAILFISRMATFIFLFITSPISVLGGVLPGLGKYSSKWWDILFKQTLLGPFIMFILYLILKITEVTGTKLPIFFAPGANSPDEKFLPYMQFMIIMVLLNFGVSGAKEYAGEVGAMALNTGKQILGTATGFAIGTAALAGQGTFGAVAQRIIDKKGEFFDPAKATPGSWRETGNKLSAKWAASKGIRSWALDPMAKGTFDPRNAVVPFGKRYLGQEVGLFGGYGSQAFGQITDGASYGTAQTRSAEKRSKEEIEMSAAEHQEQMKFLRKTATGATEDEKKLNGDIAVAKYLAENVSQDDAEEIYKKWGNTERATIHEAAAALTEQAAQGSDNDKKQAKAVQDLTDKIRGKQEQTDIENINKVIKARASKQRVVKAKSALVEILGKPIPSTGSLQQLVTRKGNIKAQLKQLSGSQIADLGKEILLKPEVSGQLTQEQLIALSRDADLGLTESDRDIIRTNIRNGGSPASKTFMNTQKGLEMYPGAPIVV